MKLSNIHTYLTVTVLLFSVMACNPKEEIAPENPCGNYIIPSANFVKQYTTGGLDNTGKDYIWDYNPDFPFDSISLPDYKINFSSPFSDTNVYKHTWYVGSEKFSNYKVWRDFSSVPNNTKITISHAMRWKPNLYCNPNDKGYDSVSQSFTVVDSVQQMGIFGFYRMVYDTLGAPQNQDSVDIEFYLSKTDPDTTRLIGASVKNPFIKYAYRIKNIYYNVLTRDTINFKKESYKIGWGDVLTNTYWFTEIIGNQAQAGITPISGVSLRMLKNNKSIIKYQNYGRWIYLRGRKLK